MHVHVSIESFNEKPRAGRGIETTAPHRARFDQREKLFDPSAWLFLGWLRPRRANFRFTKPLKAATFKIEIQYFVAPCLGADKCFSFPFHC